MNDGRATNKCLEWKRQGAERGTATSHPHGPGPTQTEEPEYRQ